MLKHKKIALKNTDYNNFDNMALNRNMQQLLRIAQKDERLGIGLMSGTSLDGLDIALCRFTGHGMQTQFELLNFITIPYNDYFKGEVRQVFAKRNADLEKLALLNAYIGNYHAALILQALEEWQIKPVEVDYIASHGQTVYHAPARQHRQPGYPNATLQIGDGDHIAIKTGIITISDFRQKHIAGGGEGAPLALYGDVLLGSKPGENRLLLNIGGIANATWLPASQNLNEVFSTDIGPGNTIIDAACKKYFDMPFDRDGEIAQAGTVDKALLDILLEHPFFNQQLPKTTGPEVFNLALAENIMAGQGTPYIRPADLIATLTAFTGESIVRFVNTYVSTYVNIYTSGGGASNPAITAYLQKHLKQAAILNTMALGINPDAKEAILFAMLGNEALAGELVAIGNNPAVLMGKFSLPY
ncbi:anhydro-N-acetylmuramic acid kinase [Mucilaginibacter sp. UR6-1]|uniref:anhydro-N-acetylmuramic acid kinase n=1 Tax=Mucilaginibacter sp. UR6-1 TaxID=1435643 RepID=UPI001E53B6ED|nr:anhydro-N-acetylmuramic acid kinase [Mucilaginibacter sp. UR6-1]MCC8410332.1 anhydro-N-acetylmuramic acid kinase [Mucilaginibacter sp. UR6-1]